MIDEKEKCSNEDNQYTSNMLVQCMGFYYALLENFEEDETSC